MREGLLYMLFVIFVLLFVSSEQSDSKQLQNDIFSSQIITEIQADIYVIPEFKFSLKEVSSGVFRFMFQKINYSTGPGEKDFETGNVKVYQIKTIGIRHLKKKLLLKRMYNLPDSEDYHHLS